MIIFYILAFCLGGVVSVEDELEEDSPTRCFHLMPHDELNEAEMIPDKEQLRAACPGMIDYFECEEKHLLKRDLAAELLEMFYQTKQIVIELCENNSRLQKDYLASVNCFRSVKDKSFGCHETGERIHSDYQKFMADKSESDATDTPNRSECLVNSYAVACLGIEMQETCGSLPHDTFVELIHRSHFLRHLCNEEDTQSLRTDFLDFLSREHTNTDAYRNIFDFKKK